MEFINIRKAAADSIARREAKELAHIEEMLPGSDLFRDWYEGSLTANEKARDFEQIKEICKKYARKKYDKERAETLAKIEAIENAPDLISVDLSIEWKPSRIWGMNPNATARIYTAEGCERVDSGSISGCGYDKESTAAANALNRSASFKRALFITFEKALQENAVATLREALGYGSGHDALPYLEGGVGVNCFARILERCGYQWKYTASGKRFAVYSVAVA